MLARLAFISQKFSRGIFCGIFYRRKFYYEIKTNLIKGHERGTLFFAVTAMRNLIDKSFEKIRHVDVDKVQCKQTFLSYLKFIYR